jgi:hypothetical protein
MTLFRIYLGIWIIAIAAYTVVTIGQHGLDYLTPYFGDIARMGWPGQFNVDFLGLLCLGGLWLAWRHHFSLGGIVLGAAILVGGMPLLGSYLLLHSYRTKGDMKALLLGEGRA